MIAIERARRSGLLARANWAPNIIAGVIVGVVALPLSMAFAIASGVEPRQGLYTAIVAALIVSLFGGTMVQIAGPTGAFIVVLAGITAKYGVIGLQVATMMAGVILIAMGLLKLGVVLKFIPAPVIVGFTAGIGVIIFTGQWANFLGMPAMKGEHFHEKMMSFFENLDKINWPTTLLATLSLAILIFAPRVGRLKRVPAPLLAMVFATAVVALLHPAGVATIGSAFGGIPSGLPRFSPPPIDFGKLPELIGPAITIAMLGSIESLLSAVVADGMTGDRHDSNQELTGQGIANLAAAAFGGFAATGAIARTATGIRNGANSPITGVVHSVFLMLILLLLAPLASNVPLAALAAILFVVAYNMSEVRHFISMSRRAPAADVAILWVTFVLTVFWELQYAVAIGVLMAIIQFLRRMSESVEVQQREGAHLSHVTLPAGVEVFSIEGPFFFGSVETFEQTLAATHTDPRVVIIRLDQAPFMDMTGLQALGDAVAGFQHRGVAVILSGANERVRLKLDRAGVAERVGWDNMAASYEEAVQTAGQIIAAARLEPVGVGEPVGAARS